VINAQFRAKVWYWRGPSPFYFVSTPAEVSTDIYAIASHFSYGWGAIPAVITIGDTEFSTSIFPRNGEYIVPLKKAVRQKENIDVDDEIAIHIDISRPHSF
jgi:hypothetical protein